MSSTLRVLQALRSSLLLAGLVTWAASGQAQVATSYNFAQSAGTYTEITGGTTLWGGFFGTFDNQVSSAQTIPSFNFDGTNYTQMYVSANGFITFGSAPSGTNFTPLSSAASYAGAIAAFGADIENRSSGLNTRDVRWQNVSGTIVIQWRNAARQGVNSENFNAQIRLNTANNSIEVVYGALGSQGSSTTQQPEVGLRGPDNTFGNNVNNRLVASGAENWATSLAGTANNSTMRFTTAAPAKAFTNGLTYTWTPNCTAPTATTSVNVDCITNTYTVTVSVTSLGSAPNVDVSSSAGGVFADDVGIGSYTSGPLAMGSAQTITVLHNSSPTCNLSLGSVNSSGTCVSNGTCLSPTLAIPDNGCATNNRVDAIVPITTAGTTLGTDVFLQSVELIIAHIANSNVQVRLVSPTGQTRNLVLNRFGGVLNSNMGNPASCPTAVLRLIDTGAALTNTGMSNVTGNWAPEQTLAGFTGDPNGAWHLQVCDNSSFFTGTLNYVKLNFAPCLPPIATTTVVPNQAAGTYTVQVNVSNTGSGATVGLESDLLGVEFASVGTGTTVMGPYSLCSPVSITVKHASNTTCDLILPTVNPGTCITNNSCLSPTLAIPDNGCGTGNSVSAYINVTAPGTSLNTDVLIQHLDLVLAHTWNSDLQVTLTSPTGQTRNMILNRFGNGDNLGNPGSCPSVVLRLRDGGTALTNTNTSNVTGVYAPEQTLVGFTGNPNGYWKLTVCDNANTDLGALVLANLSIVAKGSTNPCAPHVIGCFESIDVNSTSGAPNTLPPSACAFNGPASTGGVHWWSYTATSNDDVTFTVCNPAFDARISVFSPQPNCSNLVCVGGVDDAPGCGTGAEIKVKANIGDVFLVAVHGSGAAVGSYTIQTLCTAPSCAQPANDLCLGASNVVPVYTGLSVPVIGNNACAYVDGPTSNSGTNPVQGLWYTFNSGVNSKVRMFLGGLAQGAGSASGLKWVLFNGTCAGLGATGEVATGNASGWTTLNVTAATQYRLLVFNTGGVGVEGTFTLRLEVPGINDASISQVTSPVGLLCDTQFQPVVKLKNLGEATLTSVQIPVNIDGGAPVYTHSWSGPALAYGDSVTLTLPLVTTPTGNHTLFVSPLQPNNVADDIPTNDEASSAYQANGQTVKVRVTTDTKPSETTWVIYEPGFIPVASGGPYVLPNTQNTTTLCLSTGAGNKWFFYLFDSFGDGICCGFGSGSWQLLDKMDRMIIRDNGQFTTQSPKSPAATASYAMGHEVTLPLGPSRPWTASPYNVCGVFNLGLQSKIRCTTIPGVTTYQWEFSNPDQGYQRRVSASVNYVTWVSMQAQPPTLGVTHFVRNRADQGTAGFADDRWGEGCEMAWDNTTAFCTALISTPGSTFSCGATRTWGGSSKIWATPVVGAFPYDQNGDGDFLDAGDQANAYHFRFTGAGGYIRDIYHTTYVLPLTWVSQPLLAGNTYQVQVEVQVGGAWRSFCGATCNLTIAAGPGQGGNRIDAVNTTSELLSIWPNPISDGRAQLRVEGLLDEDQQITVDVYDPLGRRVFAERFANSGSLFNTVLDLSTAQSAGIYLVNISVNDRTYTRRLVVN